MSQYDQDSPFRSSRGSGKRRPPPRETSPFVASAWTVSIVFAAGGAFYLGNYFSGFNNGNGVKHHPRANLFAQGTIQLPAVIPIVSSEDMPPASPPQLAADPSMADLINPESPLVVQKAKSHGIPMMLIEGGVASSRRSPLRLGVEDFVSRSGAQAGLNGAFFANASLEGTDNILIGPSVCGDEPRVVLSPWDKRPALIGRPLVLISPGRIRIEPYDPATMDSDAALRDLLPGLTDSFLGGVWLVHNCQAADRAQIATFHVKDANDPRRRAFFGVTTDGRPVLGATTYVASSTQLARALAGAGLQEAVLLDSGFSTSLVDGDKILVTGHTSPGIPSRPVPHAIILFDTRNVNRTSAPMAQGSTPSVGA